MNEAAVKERLYESGLCQRLGHLSVRSHNLLVDSRQASRTL